MTYTFLVISNNNPHPDIWHLGDVIEVELKVSEYDAFKKDTLLFLERYIEDPLPFTLGRGATVPGKAMERLNRIRHTYPGAKDMFHNARYVPPREW